MSFSGRLVSDHGSAVSGIANDPPHRRVTAQAIGVVHVLVAREPPEHRLPQQSDERMPTIPAGACIRKRVTGHVGQAERIVQLPIGQQPRIGGDHRAAELQPQAPVEIEPQRPAF